MLRTAWCRPTDRGGGGGGGGAEGGGDYRAARGRSGLAPTFEVGVWVGVGWGGLGGVA